MNLIPVLIFLVQRSLSFPCEYCLSSNSFAELNFIEFSSLLEFLVPPPLLRSLRPLPYSAFRSSCHSTCRTCLEFRLCVRPCGNCLTSQLEIEQVISLQHSGKSCLRQSYVSLLTAESLCGFTRIMWHSFPARLLNMWSFPLH